MLKRHRSDSENSQDSRANSGPSCCGSHSTTECYRADPILGTSSSYDDDYNAPNCRCIVCCPTKIPAQVEQKFASLIGRKSDITCAAKRLPFVFHRLHTVQFHDWMRTHKAILTRFVTLGYYNLFIELSEWALRPDTAKTYWKIILNSPSLTAIGKAMREGYKELFDQVAVQARRDHRLPEYRFFALGQTRPLGPGHVLRLNGWTDLHPEEDIPLSAPLRSQVSGSNQDGDGRKAGIVLWRAQNPFSDIRRSRTGSPFRSELSRHVHRTSTPIRGRSVLRNRSCHCPNRATTNQVGEVSGDVWESRASETAKEERTIEDISCDNFFDPKMDWDHPDWVDLTTNQSLGASSDDSRSASPRQPMEEDPVVQMHNRRPSLWARKQVSHI